MKKAKKVGLGVLIVLLGILFMYNIYSFVSVRILKHDFATFGGYAVLEVVSGSMEPAIKPGDMIIINTKDNSYKKGDIVTFRDESNFVTHRIVSINDEEIVTKGDSNNAEDKAITKKNVVGKYVAKISNAGRILSSFKSPLTMVMIFIIGILVCIFISLDNEDNPILDEEEKEFREYLEKKKLEKKEKK